jgi:flagellar hook-associated protein 3 FlgL
MRVTTIESYQNLLNSIQTIQRRMQQDQLEITSGNKINQPSDDPAGAADVVRLTGEKTEIDQYTSNAAAAQERLNYTDSVLGNVQTMIQRIITLGESAISSTSAPSAYTAEIDTLRAQLVSTANTNYQGTYLFGGTVADKPPYAVQPDQSVAYQGNSNAPSVQVSRSSTLQTQIPGNQVFSGSVNVFDSIKQLSDAITAGDKSAIQAQVNNLQRFYDSMSTVRSQIGSLSNQSQAVQSDLQSYELARAADQSRVQSADLAQATTDFTQTETALQAAMAVGAKISQISLLDYVK